MRGVVAVGQMGLMRGAQTKRRWTVTSPIDRAAGGVSMTRRTLRPGSWSTSLEDRVCGPRLTWQGVDLAVR